MATAELVDIAERIAACRDPKDGKFLELADNGRADQIVSGDRDLLTFDPFRDISTAFELRRRAKDRKNDLSEVGVVSKNGSARERTRAPARWRGTSDKQKVSGITGHAVNGRGDHHAAGGRAPSSAWQAAAGRPSCRLSSHGIRFRTRPP
jgi:hypothetical protein